jgi:hypothetical protein
MIASQVSKAALDFVETHLEFAELLFDENRHIGSASRANLAAGTG